ncbi:MAG: S-layer homology domain-containing protein [[Clostridium] scindens]|uniref:S-layer homology domain-containing protein n=1 Tax=Clostridia TaxID=186801 RepID=UPI000C775C7E|nr:hypothetical protein [Pseudoflavonifractor sp. MCC625]MCB5856096.1 S-layer homology domain-containing protein [Flavonifractor plautii]
MRTRFAGKKKLNPPHGCQYYSSAVIWAASNQITARTSATTFSPEAVVSRAQAMTFLYRERT